ncbi:MAG: cyclic nucleotide-binding domain-containing protein [Marivibrio sp.]|uniref:Crp/Fnr family transcriptional regulator n=1 Tax=Marivibrio sp. TaxID=2039719 RepID=UPI0032F05233
MPAIEILGYAASGVVFATFWMRTMIPLRIVAIVSNLLFFGYGLWGDLAPIVILHGALLPLNAVRLHQAVRLRRRLRQIAHAAFDPQALAPFMGERPTPAGAVLFERGDAADAIYYLASGRARVVELDVPLPPGSLVGEIALFAPDRRRTQTVRCESDCLFLRISEERVLQLFAENPEFGLYLVKMMVARLLENKARDPARLEAVAGGVDRKRSNAGDD